MTLQTDITADLNAIEDAVRNLKGDATPKDIRRLKSYLINQIDVARDRVKGHKREVGSEYK